MSCDVWHLKIVIKEIDHEHRFHSPSSEPLHGEASSLAQSRRAVFEAT